MKNLKDIYPQLEQDVFVKDIKTSSLEIEEGDVFVCTKGYSADRHDYAEDAVKRGAKALIISREVNVDVPCVMVEDTNRELPVLAAKFYDHPDRKLTMIGITGTDGKTSTSTMIQQLIGTDICGYIGTNGVYCDNYEADTPNTTPDADKLYCFLDHFVSAGCKYVSMEVSSEALMRDRTAGVLFDAAAYTNVTSEHINIHGTFEQYVKDKSKLFRKMKDNGFCIVNTDDPQCDVFVKAAEGTVRSYGKKEDADLRICSIVQNTESTDIVYAYEGKEYKVHSPLLGEFNVYNLAAALLVLLSLGFDMETLNSRIDGLSVDGRVTMLKTDADYHVMVDYAHTPNGIENILKLADTLPVKRKVVVIGAAGTRDPYKRPLMGKTICDHPDTFGIFTYEDPRNEDPADICDDLTREIVGYDNYEIILDRRDAIERAVNMLEKDDLALILGKGNEDEEILKDGPIEFNDIKVAYEMIAKRNGK